MTPVDELAQQHRIVADLLELVHGLADGTRVPADWDPGLTCPDAADVARDGSAQELGDELAKLRRLTAEAIGAGVMYRPVSAA